MNNQGTLTVTSDQTIFFLNYTKYQLIINGKRIGVFKPDQTQVVQIPCGEVEVEVERLSWLMNGLSGQITLDVTPESSHHLEFSTGKLFDIYAKDEATQVHVKNRKRSFSFYLTWISLAIYFGFELYSYLIPK